MNIFDLLEAMVKLGLPLFLISWVLFSRLYDSGDIDRSGDRKADKAQLKAYNKASKKKAKTGRKSFVDRVMWHWSSFGGGFYGLAALWTFVVIEFQDLIGFIFNFPGLKALFEDGVISLLVSILVNQITNAVSALIWFSYWPAQSILIWVVAAYLSYWLGMDLAKRGYSIPFEKLMAAIRS